VSSFSGWNSLSMGHASACTGYLLFAVAATMWAEFGTLTKLWHVDAIGVTAAIAVLWLVTVPVWVPLLPMQLAGARWGMIALQASYMGLLVGVASMYLYTRAIALLGS